MSSNWQKIEHIYQEALEREPGQRAAYIKEACGGDEVLLREVESLLAYQPRAEDFLAAPALQVAARKLAEDKDHTLVGRQIGAYQIVSLIGRGGMGEVYRATDTRLKRTVAIKVLPSHLSGNPELRQRLEREARAVSNLNHPHICTLYDIGTQDGIDFLVMEYLEGETISARLKRGALSLDQVLNYAIEIADALSEAHRRGIVHRDLKPGNVMLTKNGAKLLDFGLAKHRVEAASSRLSTRQDAASTFKSLTEEGTILGTLEYMAPEQVEGKEVDSRTDIFALGTVVYEMVTGSKAFAGESKASLIAAIMSSEPPRMSTLQPLTPPALDHVIKLCLAKDPSERWQNAHDLASQLKWIAESHSQVMSSALVDARLKKKERLAWAAAVVLLFVMGLGLGSFYFYHKKEPAAGSIRFILSPPNKLKDVPALYTNISPDGRRVAMSSGSSILVRSLDSLSEQELSFPGIENLDVLFWSPDSRSIGFVPAGSKLMKIEATGGTPQLIYEAPNPIWRAVWGRHGDILFYQSDAGGILRVSSEGGAASLATKIDESRQEYEHDHPCFLPDGRHFFYVIRSRKKEVTGIYLGSLDSKASTRLLEDDTNVAYSPPGYLLFQRSRRLLAQPFDAKSLQLTGKPIPIAEQVRLGQPGNMASFSVSETGMLTYLTGNIASQVTKFDRTGRKVDSIGPPGDYEGIELSPNGTQVVLEQSMPETNGGDIFTINLLSGVKARLTTASTSSSWRWDYCPRWSPDGRRVLFSSNRDQFSDQPDSSGGNFYLKASNGAGNETPLLKSSQHKFPEDWSRDGGFILYSSASFIVVRATLQGWK